MDPMAVVSPVVIVPLGRAALWPGSAFSCRAVHHLALVKAAVLMAAAVFVVGVHPEIPAHLSVLAFPKRAAFQVVRVSNAEEIRVVGRADSAVLARVVMPMGSVLLRPGARPNALANSAVGTGVVEPAVPARQASAARKMATAYRRVSVYLIAWIRTAVRMGVGGRVVRVNRG